MKGPKKHMEHLVDLHSAERTIEERYITLGRKYSNGHYKWPDVPEKRSDRNHVLSEPGESDERE